MMLLALLASLLAHAETPDLPPPVLFHVGEKAALEADGRAGTVPKEAWDEFVMGGKSTWDLAPYRHGLYGSDNLDGLEFYLNYLTGSDRKPWMMAIRVKESCRRPESVSSLYFDDRYGAFVISHINEILAEVPQCLDVAMANEYGSCNVLLTGNIAHTRPENVPCDRWPLRFLEENHIRVVKDTPWLDSWYLRDRDCIEKISAGPQDILAALAGARWDAKTRGLTRSNLTNGSGFLRLLVAALADSDHADPALLEKIHALGTASDIDSSRGTPERDARPWLKEVVPAVVEAYQRCEKQNGPGIFREAAAKFDAFMSTPAATETAKFLAGAEELKAALGAACR